MRHLILLLLCMGICLAATARVPQSKLNLSVTPNLRNKVVRPNRLVNHYTLNPERPNVMAGAKKSLQRQQMKPDNLVNKRAPRRLSDADMVSMPSICFLYAYDIMGDEPVPADPYYAGGSAYWYPDPSDGLYLAGFYWDAEGSTYYLPIDIDYSTGEVALPWGILLADDTTSNNPGGRSRTDTVRYELLVSQDYWENQEQNDCMGTLYADGSIIFDDNYVYYALYELKSYRNSQLISDDATETAIMYVGTEILTANGELTYTLERNGSAQTSPVYIYQMNPDTVIVANLWDYGMPYSYMIMHQDSTFTYPCCEYDPDVDVTYLYNPIWDVNDTWIEGGFGMFYPVSSYTFDDQGYVNDVTWGFEGVGNSEQLTWDYTTLCNGYHLTYGYENNVLRYTNGNQFIFPRPPYEGLRGDVNDDEQVDFKDLIALRDFFITGDFDSINYDNADCNLDGTVNYIDAAVLIDYVLNGTWPED